jgi:hypothetical protein
VADDRPRPCPAGLRLWYGLTVFASRLPQTGGLRQLRRAGGQGEQEPPSEPSTDGLSTRPFTLLKTALGSRTSGCGKADAPTPTRTAPALTRSAASGSAAADVRAVSAEARAAAAGARAEAQVAELNNLAARMAEILAAQIAPSSEPESVRPWWQLWRRRA